jgi:flagellar motor switch protein FliN
LGKFHTRIEGRDFSPTEQRVIPPGRSDLRRVPKAWKGIYPLELEYQRSEMQPQFANIATPSEIVVASSFTLEIGETTGTVHFCIPYSTLEPIRDVLYSTIQGDSVEPDRRWVNLLKHADPGRRGELVAELATRPATVEQLLAFKPGDFIELDLETLIQAKVDGVPVFDCHYGTSNNRYAIKIDKTADRCPTRAGWEQTMTPDDPNAAGSDQDAWPPNGPPRWPRASPRPTTGHGPAKVASRQRRRWRRPTFTNFSPTGPWHGQPGNDINMILDIPVQLTVELGRTRIPIKHILQLAQGSVVELDALAGEPMDVLVNGYLIAQGEVVVVNDKFGIRLTDIVTPSERMRRLSKGQ